MASLTREERLDVLHSDFAKTFGLPLGVSVFVEHLRPHALEEVMPTAQSHPYSILKVDRCTHIGGPAITSNYFEGRGDGKG